MGSPCEGDRLALPDSTTLISVQASAENGDAHAQARLGAAYFRGKGIEQDTAKAISWLEKSAAGGDSDGQYFLGIYTAGKAKSPAEFQKAAGLLKQSADQGCIPPLLYLGLLTKQGKGVPKNTDAGMEMITRAANEGYVPAELTLGAMLSTGDEIKKDRKTAFEWIKRAADTGDSAAQIILAGLYNEGLGTKQDHETSVKLLESVIKKRDEQSPTAAYALGWMYMEGKGIGINKPKSLELMIFAANSHISDSQARVKTLTEELPKQTLVSSCSVYMEPRMGAGGSKEYLRADKGEQIVVLSEHADSAEVYFFARPLVGFIAKNCL